MEWYTGERKEGKFICLVSSCLPFPPVKFYSLGNYLFGISCCLSGPEVAAQGNRSPVQQGGASFNSEGEVDLATDGVLAQQCRDKVVKLCIPYSGDNAILSPE